jgi:TRAP-type C4-dicarboxylate transport system substrate-binding protein
MRMLRGGRLTTSRAIVLAAAFVLLACGRGLAEPIILKLSFYTSDRSTIYQCQVKPFVDAVNADGVGLVKIEVYFSGAISSSQAEQPNLVRGGQADLAAIVPGATPNDFPDTAVFGVPGLFETDKEASLVFSRLIAAGALKGYDPFFVVGAYVLGGESIHSRKPIASVADLKGQIIRVNNEIVADVLKQLGAAPVIMPINRAMDALSQGQIDGVVVVPAVLSEFGFSRLAQNHYLLPIGAAPLAMVMSQARFASLPPRAQDIIRAHSGRSYIEQVTACTDARNREVVAQLRAAPLRTVVEPSPADLAAARAAYGAAIREWTSASPGNLALMDKVKSDRDALRKASPQ